MEEAVEDSTARIYVLKEHAWSDEPEDIGIVLEGIKVLKDTDICNIGFHYGVLDLYMSSVVEV